ncbi:MAG: GNAT family N-acetyltransferase [Anaerolineaceae bacterium]|nr:GNAT family N-acetyltransferase [Anaerolineaceae bacterium]
MNKPKHQFLIDIPALIETQRLCIRSYRAGDGEMYYQAAQRNWKHLERYEAQNSIRNIETMEDAEILVRRYAAAWGSREYFMFGVFEKGTDAFVGQVYLGVANWALPEFEIGYFVDVDHEGRGFVTEAVKGVLRMIFVDLLAHRARIECDDTNQRSAAVAERCGFTLEGHIRENHPRPDGSITGTLWYGMLRSEFEQAR